MKNRLSGKSGDILRRYVTARYGVCDEDIDYFWEEVCKSVSLKEFAGLEEIFAEFGWGDGSSALAMRNKIFFRIGLFVGLCRNYALGVINDVEASFVSSADSGVKPVKRGRGRPRKLKHRQHRQGGEKDGN